MTNNIQEKLDNISKLNLSDIALLIEKTWPNVSLHAKPYLNAMYTLQDITDSYGVDDGEMIVAYFLSNARGYRGTVARQVKEELNLRIKSI